MNQIYEFKPKCPKCANFMTKAGIQPSVKNGKRQRFRCSNCGTIRLGEKIPKALLT